MNFAIPSFFQFSSHQDNILYSTEYSVNMARWHLTHSFVCCKQIHRQTTTTLVLDKQVCFLSTQSTMWLARIFQVLPMKLRCHKHGLSNCNSKNLGFIFVNLAMDEEFYSFTQSVSFLIQSLAASLTWNSVVWC